MVLISGNNFKNFIIQYGIHESRRINLRLKNSKDNVTANDYMCAGITIDYRVLQTWVQMYSGEPFRILPRAELLKGEYSVTLTLRVYSSGIDIEKPRMYFFYIWMKQMQHMGCT